MKTSFQDDFDREVERQALDEAAKIIFDARLKQVSLESGLTEQEYVAFFLWGEAPAGKEAEFSEIQP